jgi:hypothetical protein
MTLTRIRTLAVALALIVPFAASAQEVRDREVNQQRRINQGLESGQLTAGEAGRLEQREANIDASRRADLAANGGHLTPGEYRNLNRRENAVSAQIYRDKHNGITQPGLAPR